MQRVAAPRVPQLPLLPARVAAPRRACAALASRRPTRESSRSSHAPPREPPAALRRALLPPLRAPSRPGRSCLVRAAEVRTQPHRFQP
jgi:hypothetical protein